MDLLDVDLAIDGVELLARLRRCVAEDRRATARLLLHLAEVDSRGLYRDEGFSSMFEYCVRSLGMSESETALRIRVARFGRVFPEALQLLARGELHLSALGLLAPVVTLESVSLLHEARHKSKREVEELIARRFPQADVSSMIRKLPAAALSLAAAQHGSTPQQSLGAPAASLALRGSDPAVDVAARAVDALEDPTSLASSVGRTAVLQRSAVGGGVVPSRVTPAIQQPSAVRAPVPLSEGRYKVQFTASQALRDKLAQAEHLLRHQVPDGDVAVIIERALDLLIAERMKRQFAQTARPRRARTMSSDARESVRAELSCASRRPHEVTSSTRGDQQEAAGIQPESVTSDACVHEAEHTGAKLPPARSEAAAHQASRGTRGRSEAAAHCGVAGASRHIPSSVKREVVARDGACCSFVAPDGRRCSERGKLQFHHELPFARGGAPSVENIRLLCRAHNVLLAERDFGRSFIVGVVTSKQRPDAV